MNFFGTTGMLPLYNTVMPFGYGYPTTFEPNSVPLAPAQAESPRLGKRMLPLDEHIRSFKSNNFMT